MPEGPEAAYVAAAVHKKFGGRELQAVKFLRGRYVNHGPPAHFNEFHKALPLKLVSVDKKGKVIFFHFADGWTIVSRLGMTGWWYADTAGAVPSWRAEVRSVEFDFGDRVLVYSDPRSYGTLSFTKTPQKDIDELAPDIMDKGTTWRLFSTRATATVKNRPNMPIEELLVDQKRLVSGIGNYLKSEIMYAAKIAPMRPIGKITEAEWKLVFKHAKRICTAMTRALASKSEAAYETKMAVYGKKEDTYGNNVETYSNKAKRTVHWVPAVQS
jgi:formamidopyrimidine-DNA glycosylase